MACAAGIAAETGILVPPGGCVGRALGLLAKPGPVGTAGVIPGCARPGVDGRIVLGRPEVVEVGRSSAPLVAGEPGAESAGAKDPGIRVSLVPLALGGGRPGPVVAAGTLEAEGARGVPAGDGLGPEGAIERGQDGRVPVGICAGGRPGVTGVVPAAVPAEGRPGEVAGREPG
ncbi:MAG TPA: hypothetical protein VMT11_14680 [Myxococcaceae bacterium]|nr:hypothetical protein [Myxococcaceae bacterium]